jgi:putative methanogenesis marker protein 8
MKEGISRALRSKITQFGHFTKKRELLRNDIAIPFGASEMIMYGLQRKGIEAAVTVCDGAGTIITAEPSLVQGIGARMNGLFYTSPVKEVIRRIGENHGFILCPRTAAIDQISGIKKAVELGYRKVAVTINGFAGEDLHKVREVERQTNSFVTILVVCTTGVERERAEEIGEYADLVWSCASLHVRDVVGKRATLQIAVKIPVFVLTRRGIDFVSYYSSPEFGKSIEEGKRYIIMGHLKSNVHNPKKIRMDNFDTYLGEIDQLPSRVEDEPRPLT